MNDSQNDAVRFAVRLLRYRGRSEKELAERLRQKDFSGRTISAALDRLKKSGLIDDAALARSLDEIARNVKLLGNRGVEYFLKRRGIAEELIPGEQPEDQELERALAFVGKKKKALASCPVDVQIRRLQGALQRRGYGFETIRKALESLFGTGERPL